MGERETKKKERKERGGEFKVSWTEQVSEREREHRREQEREGEHEKERERERENTRERERERKAEREKFVLEHSTARALHS